MTLPVTPHFRHRWTVFWATTYTFDLRTFDEFWLPRLGETPLNVTILADFQRLADVWSRIPPGEHWRLRRANRHYLVRGIPRAGRAFHPKTYFFADRNAGTLLVGSGNLTLEGLEEGHEVFCRFESMQDADLAAIRSWRDWMDAVITQLDDHQVTTRWHDLQQKVPWLSGAAGPAGFVTNWERSLLAQFADGLSVPVQELHVLAPFYDSTVQALAQLVSATRPQELHVYVGQRVSVDGEQLKKVLDASGAVPHVYRYDPDEFVHAKLIGAVVGEAGRLLSGSANLTQAALLRTARTRQGNVEAGVLLETDAKSVRAAFAPPQLQVSRGTFLGLEGLRHQRPSDPGPARLALHRAVRLPDERIEVVYSGDSGTEALFLSNGPDTQAIRDGRTVEPCHDPERWRLVWLTSDAGKALSNRVPADEPEPLQEALHRRSDAANRPRELDPQDWETPIGSVLERLNRECIFDLDDTRAGASLTGEGPADETEAEDPEFWERLAQEELRLDPRYYRYARFASPGELDGTPLVQLLVQMREKAGVPQDHQRRAGASTSAGETTGTGTRWRPGRRLQLRVYNVLSRWCAALNDPRLRWINVFAPARNYGFLVETVVELAAQRFFPLDRLASLGAVLFSSFICTEEVKGYLFSVSEDERRQILTSLDPALFPMAAALAYYVLRSSAPWHDSVFEWQAFLKPGLSLGLIRPDEDATVWVEELTAEQVPADDVAGRITWATEYMDDARWSELAQRQLGFSAVTFTQATVHGRFGVTIEVAGEVPDPLGDPRLVTLVRRVLAYRKVRGTVVFFAEAPDDRLSVNLGSSAVARVEHTIYRSREPVTDDTLAALEDQDAGWSAVLAPHQQA